MTFTKDYDADNSVWMTKLSGEVDIYNAEELKKQLHQLVEENPASLVIQCDDLEYIDSTGLGVLVSALKVVNDNGGTITIKGLKTHIAKVFHLTGLSKIMQIEVAE